MNRATYRWRIAKTEQETPSVRHLYLEAVGERPVFVAGQYLTVQFPDMGPAEGKSYSISSAPTERLIRLSIKRMGSFSEKILSLQEGDEVTTSAPYGFFYPEPKDRAPLVFIVGGIGITPCLSIIKALTQAQDPRVLRLEYSSRSEEEIIFRKELDALVSQNPKLSVQYYITRKGPVDTTKIFGRMVPEKLVAANAFDVDPEFFICGSIDFTRDLWRGMHRCGVPSHRLYTEGFF